MREKKTILEDYHPIILFLFFAVVIGISMLDSSIITGSVSLVAGLLFLAFLLDTGKLIGAVIRTVIIVALLTVTNPLFSHNGATPLFFVNDQAYTLEAVFYGLHIGLMLTSVLNWFQILNICMGSEKWIYLTGRFMPGLALLISMVLRLIPIMKDKYSELKQADEGISGAEKSSWGSKVATSLRLFLGMAGWTMEYMPQVSASMRARGYGSKKRTTMSIYYFRLREAILTIALICIIALIIIFKLSYVEAAYYYPVFYVNTTDNAIIYYFIAGILFLLPSIREGADRIQWMYYKSKI